MSNWIKIGIAQGLFLVGKSIRKSDLRNPSELHPPAPASPTNVMNDPTIMAVNASLTISI
jgi:hypothetical protein